jgi:hypothetical protein
MEMTSEFGKLSRLAEKPRDWPTHVIKEIIVQSWEFVPACFVTGNNICNILRHCKLFCLRKGGTMVNGINPHF